LIKQKSKNHSDHFVNFWKTENLGPVTLLRRPLAKILPVQNYNVISKFDYGYVKQDWILSITLNWTNRHWIQIIKSNYHKIQCHKNWIYDKHKKLLDQIQVCFGLEICIERIMQCPIFVYGSLSPKFSLWQYSIE
jgi:hypothetical protein